MNDLVVALQRLVVPQFRKPEWVVWTRAGQLWSLRYMGWHNTHKDIDGWHIDIDFNHNSGVHIVEYRDYEYRMDHYPWADPDCDKQISALINNWLTALAEIAM